MAGARTFSLPTITNEATELLAITETAAIAPLVAFIERVGELNLSVLANMNFGKIGVDKSSILAYVKALDALDKQIAGLEDEVSRMNPDEDSEYEPEAWAHAIMDLQARAHAMVMTNGMGQAVTYGSVGGRGVAKAASGDEEDGGYERMKHTAMRTSYGWTFEESQLGSRADQLKIKAQVVGEFSWPSHERVPYHKLRDAAGGRVADPSGFLQITPDGKVHVEQTQGAVDGDLESTRELLSQYSILLRTVLFVGVEVKPPSGYDAAGTGVSNDGTGETYIVGMQEVQAMIAILDSKRARSIPKSALHELLKNLTTDLRELTREPTMLTVGAALKQHRPAFQTAIANASTLADQLRADRKKAEEEAKKAKAAALAANNNGGGGGKWNGGGGGGGGNGQRNHPYGGNGGGGRNGGGGNWFNGNNGNNSNGNNNSNNNNNNSNGKGGGNGGGGGKGNGGGGWTFQHTPGGGPRPPPGAPPGGGRQAGGNPNAPPCIDHQRGRCNRAQCAFSHN
jgi:hypothetical protein